MRYFISLLIALFCVHTKAQDNDSLRREILMADTFQVALAIDYGDTTFYSQLTVNHRNGNWYKVEYTNPSGEKTHRVIHRHRIKKFSEKMNFMHRACFCQEHSYSEFTFTTKGKSTSKRISDCNDAYTHKRLKILKIWYYRKD